ncbi:hypothetical protein KI387_024886, partial [Taxus chinensis]
QQRRRENKQKNRETSFFSFQVNERGSYRSTLSILQTVGCIDTKLHDQDNHNFWRGSAKIDMEKHGGTNTVWKDWRNNTSNLIIDFISVVLPVLSCLTVGSFQYLFLKP